MSDIRRGRKRFESEISRMGTEEMKGRMMQRIKRIKFVYKLRVAETAKIHENYCLLDVSAYGLKIFTNDSEETSTSIFRVD
jgi:hypothetical protein